MGSGVDFLADPFVCRGADEDLIPCGVFLNAFGGVDGVADGGVFESLFGADQTENGVAAVNACAKTEMEFRRQFFIQVFHRFADDERGLHGAQGMVRLRNGGVEPGHDGIAHELVNGACLHEHGFGHGGEVAVQDLHQFFWFLIFAKGGESADICEQGGDVRAFTAQLQTVRVELFDHSRGDHTLEESALGFELFALGQVIKHDGDALCLLACIFERREIETPVHVAVVGQVVADLKVYDGFVGLADLCQMRLKFGGNGSKRLVKMMTDDVAGGRSEDAFRGAVGERDLILNIGSDHTAGDGCEDVIHQILQACDLFEGVLERGEQTGVLDRNCGLIRKSNQQVPL